MQVDLVFMLRVQVGALMSPWLEIDYAISTPSEF